MTKSDDVPVTAEDDETLAELGYAEGYEWFRNKWIGDHVPMIADLVRCFVPRLAAEQAPRAGEGEVEHCVRAAYADWPYKVISQALADVTGLPMGAVIDYDTAIRVGMNPSGLRRTVAAAIAALSAKREGEVERLREALRQIADGTPVHLEHGGTAQSPINAREAQRIARAALSPDL